MDVSFEEIYEGSKAAVLRYIAAHCLNISDVEDIFQETYLRAYETLSVREDIADPEAFVMGIAKHCTAGHYSVVSRIASRLFGAVVFGSCDDVPDGEDIEELTEDRVLFDEIVSELCTKPAEVQRIFYLHYLLGLSLDETAAELRISPGRVRQQLYKALRQLRRKYRRRDNDD